MTLTDFRFYLDHSPFLNYMMGFATAGLTFWVIEKILKSDPKETDESLRRAKGEPHPRDQNTGDR